MRLISKLLLLVSVWATLSKYLEYMQNLFAILCAKPDIGALRESFFVSMLEHKYQVHYHNQGDFLIDDKFIVEIDRGIRLCLFGYGNAIPLWLFGFIY